MSIEIDYRSLAELESYAKRCVTHHFACDCRELAWRKHISEIERRYVAVESQLAAKDRRIAELEAKNSVAQERLEATTRVLAGADDRNDKIDLELIRLRGALAQIANNEDPDAHWSFDVARSALRAAPGEKTCIQPACQQKPVSGSDFCKDHQL